MGSEGAELGPVGGPKNPPLCCSGGQSGPQVLFPKGFCTVPFFFFARLKPMGRGNPAPNPCGHLWVKGGAGIKDLFRYGGLLAPKLLPNCVVGKWGELRSAFPQKNF